MRTGPVVSRRAHTSTDAILARARPHYNHAAISHLVPPSSDLLGEAPDASYTTCCLV